ncbi:unnamed protein product [Urochloa humidicola]
MASKRTRDGGGGADHLSALPDCLLHTNMSFLKARQVVQTCVLSSRWRHLWRSVPCLDIDFDEFRADVAESPDLDNIHDPDNDGHSSDSDGGSSGTNHDSSDSEDSGDSENTNDSSESDIDNSSSSSSSSSFGHNVVDKEKEKEWEGFEDFTVNLLQHCNVAQLDAFRLHIGRGTAPWFGDKQVAGWLRRAMKYCTPDPAPQRKGLSSGYWLLKRLHLCYVILDDRFEEHVRTVCHCLEDLELEDCKCGIIQSITSHSLKTLVLKRCRWRNLKEITCPKLKTLVIDGGSNVSFRPMVILAPAVAYLHLAVNVNRFYGGISMNEMPSLAKSLIYLHGHIYSGPLGFGGDQFKLLRSVFNVTSLELCGVGTTVLGKEPTFQEFKNLRSLVLGNCDLSDDFRTLRFFLQNSPYLEKLTLRCCQFPKYCKEKKGTPEQNKTSSSEFRGLDSVCENLKVEIVYKHGDACQFVKFLLHASGNLLKSNIKLTKVKYGVVYC